MKISFVVLTIFLAFGTAILQAQSPQSDEQLRMGRKLKAIVPELQKRSPVPPRLMMFFPRLDKADDLYVNIRSADSRGYEVIVGFDPDCEGQNVCGYAILRGSTAPLHEIVPEGKWDTVTLRGGVKARYYDARCFAFCSYSVVAWTEGKWNYTIELKAEKKSLVVKAANSALGSD